MTFESLKEVTNNFEKEMLFHKEVLTPALAERLLVELNTKNRKLTPSRIVQYTNDIEAGRWLRNGDSIRISKTGKLINGQHTCSAVIKAGKSIVINLETGLPDEAFHTIDQQKTRTANDMVFIEGFANASVLSATLKFIYNFVKDKLTHDTKDGYFRHKVTNAELKEFMDALGTEELQRISSIVQYAKDLRCPLLHTSHVASLYYMLATRQYGVAKINQFFQLLTTGEGLLSTSPVYQYRERLIKSAGKDTLSPWDKMVLGVKAFTNFYAGKEINRMRTSTKMPNI